MRSKINRIGLHSRRLACLRRECFNNWKPTNRKGGNMQTNTSLVIETHNLSKAYKGVEALKDLNLKVKQHSIFGFLGPNGAGKTTTHKLLLGLARPTGGSALVFGQDIQKDSVSIRRKIGY